MQKSIDLDRFKRNFMDLSIIIVSWNVREKLRENLAALYRSQGDFSFEVFVVDNNSRDKTAEMVLREFPKVKLITNHENLGFAKANNQAIRYTSSRYVLLLNPDMRVFPDTLENMIGWLDNHSKVWVAGCKLVDERGRVIRQVRRLPTVWDQLLIILKLPHLFPGLLNKYLCSNFDYNQAAKVDSIRGGFFMINVGVMRASPLLDEQFFLWFEEVDYCRRVKEAGGEVWYTPAAECIDLVGQSFKQLPRGLTQKYFRDSQLKYFKKWQPTWQYNLLKFVWPIGMVIATIGEVFKIKSRVKT